MAGRGRLAATGNTSSYSGRGRVHSPRPQNGERGCGLREIEGSGGGLLFQGPYAPESTFTRQVSRGADTASRSDAGTQRFLPRAVGRRGDFVIERGTGKWRPRRPELRGVPLGRRSTH